jgi:aconitate hydratase
MTVDSFGARSTLKTPQGDLTYYRLDAAGDVRRLPYSIKVLLESVLRNLDGFAFTEEHVRALVNYDPKNVGEQEIPFMPGRVVLQDFTGVPAVVDLAALRSAMQRFGGDVQKVNPLVPCDLVIDHSVQVDAFGSPQALEENAKLEFERNAERYEFLKWGQRAFENFRVVPPATGIVHQVNLEYLAPVVMVRDGVAFPDSLVGTDSHTTMINGIGVVGWGVGGIEAEAVMLGQPIYMLVPEVIGFELTGKLPEGATATDLVLTVTQMLRKKGVVNKFVEFYGAGLTHLSLPDRATIANMAPEYGATIGFFPIDDQSLKYMEQTGRSPDQVATVEAYARANGLWRDDTLPIQYTDVLKLDLAQVQPSLAGPRRPQDRVVLKEMKGNWALERANYYKRPEPKTATLEMDGGTHTIGDGSVVIAAITSCTNTSNPDVLVAAGLVAKKAVERGLQRKPWVKTSLAPGSRVVDDYLQKAGLMAPLEAIGFNTIGYGCTTCIGNSGPLIPEVSTVVKDQDLVVAAVLSGNRNFEGRVNPQVKPSYLASPPLVVAYALAGTVDIDFSKEPIGTDTAGKPVFLRDIWPSNDEVHDTVRQAVTRDQFEQRYGEMDGPAPWQAIQVGGDPVYGWSASSTYIQEPPFFVEMGPEVKPIAAITGARVLAKLGDSITTDHISPAGSIAKDSPAARYLVANGVQQKDFNSYGARRGNDRVMTRGTFANIRIKNELCAGVEGGYTTYLGETADNTKLEVPVEAGKVVSIYDAAMAYKQAGTPLVILAGRDYGMGSSRDWAAKGTYLLGVKAVIAESFERIHRSNLVGMGVLPLEFAAGESRESLGLTGRETFDIAVGDDVKPLEKVTVTARGDDGQVKTFQAVCRLDTPVDVEYYRNGGILHTVLRRMAQA